MEEINRLFYGDEVYFMCPASNFLKMGLVVNGAEWKVTDNLKKIQVVWYPDGDKEVISANKVKLVDRLLMAGSIVSKYHDGKLVGQLGYCENVDVYTNVKICTTNKMLPNICADNFNYTTTFEVGSTVIYNMWVGEIFNVIQSIIFTTEDGCVFSLEDPFKEDFMCLTTNAYFTIDDSVFQRFHVGQQLKMCADALRYAKVLKTSPTMPGLLHTSRNQNSATWIKVFTQHVRVSSVEVKWCPQQCPATYALETNMPPRLFTRENLEKLETLSSRAIHLGDTFSYTIKDNDQIAEIDHWLHLYSEVFNNNPHDLPQFKLQKQKVYNEFGDEDIAAIKLQKHNQKCEKKFEMKSMSNPSQYNLNTISINNVILPQSRLTNAKLKPFTQKLYDNTQCYRSVKRKLPVDLNTNVIVEVLNTKTLVDVLWADGTREVGIAATDLYPVHDDTYSLKYKPNVFVLPENPISSIYGVIKSALNVERTGRVGVQWFNMEGNSRTVTTIPKIMNESVQKLRYHPMYNLKFGTLVIELEEVPEPSKTFTIGKVISVEKDGKMLVTWSNGKIEKHWPQKLLVIKNGFTYQHIFRDVVHPEWLISKPNCLSEMTTVKKIEKSLFDLLKLGNDGIRTLTKYIYFTVPSTDLLDQVEEAIEQVMRGFYVIPFFAYEKFQSELKKIYKSIINLVIQIIETAYQKFEVNQELDEFKDRIDNLFLRLSDQIFEYTQKIEDILFDFVPLDQEL